VVFILKILEYLDSQIPAGITIHIICDNVSVHKGRKVQQWLAKNPRFVFHFTPVHCSWMNQVEQWFSILQRKRFKITDFESKNDLRKKSLSSSRNGTNMRTRSSGQASRWKKLVQK